MTLGMLLYFAPLEIFGEEWAVDYLIVIVYDGDDEEEEEGGDDGDGGQGRDMVSVCRASQLYLK
jgi:hypothetical protein